MKKIAMLTSLLLASVMFVSTVFAVPAEPTKNDFYIDSTVQGKERMVIEEAMKRLDPDERKNLIIFTEDGQIYANRPNLKESVSSLTLKEGNKYVDKKGKEYILPESCPKPVIETTGDVDISSATPPSCTASGSGPYRRVFSKTGYAWFGGYVYLPDANKTPVELIDFGINDPDEYPYQDTAHIYSGGWGNTGTNVDAGLMHNPGKKNWSMFIRVDGGGDYADPLRLKPGQNTYLRFKVVSDGQVAVYVNAVDINGNNVERTYQLAASGWTVSGSGNIIKRLTTIAQDEEVGESYNTGALIANSRWYSSKIGTSSTNNHTWAATDTGGYCSYPSDKITVNWVSPAEETVKIDLR